MGQILQGKGQILLLEKSFSLRQDKFDLSRQGLLFGNFLMSILLWA